MGGTSGRCGCEISTDALPTSAGGHCCWRPTWGDSSRCVWHTECTGKPVEALTATADPGRRLDGAILTDVDGLSEVPLSGTTLANASLSGADLRGVRLRDVDLRGATLERVDLRDSDLSGGTVQLRYADLSEARLRHADLSNADLRFASLRDADLVRASLTGAKVAGATLTGATIISTRLAGATLRNADIRDALLHRARLANAQLKGASLSGADCYEADLSGADLQKAILEDARLRGTDLSGADLTDATLENADARGIDLSGATLTRSVLTRANLFDANLSGTTVYGAVFVDAKINERTEFGFDRGSATPLSDATLSDLDRLGWRYRVVERLSRQNALPEQARRAYRRRKTVRRRRHRKSWAVAKWTGATLSGGVMRYGEGPWRVLGVSAAVVFAGALLYPLPPGEGLYVSLVSFLDPLAAVAGLPAWARYVAVVQSLAGVLLIALLVFVFGRRSTY